MKQDFPRSDRHRSLICIGVFTQSLEALLVKGQIPFNIIPSPSSDMYFPFYPFIQVSVFEITGHALMFAILTCLLFINAQRLNLAFIISLLFAIVTELLQPFFGRGADFYDLFANFIGIITVVFFYIIEKVFTRESIYSPENK
ncbi:VanZ family protein [Bacillus sp. FJAT-27251]|uniref:VanZ family protein n=1 Tax=Bacillus sp. FJAT-27251 TaxID=1684142 RepID=UPI0006A797C6|nr:VanZ family protein [Bacillus sp. FJAT-27251]